jgi:predicted RNA-binding protein YlqC (UPF0109 family)
MMTAATKNLATENIRDQIADAISAVLSLLVEHPQSITVQYVIGESTTIFRVETDQRNIGQVLGSRGKHIDSLRTLVSSMAGKHNIRAIIEIPYFPK